jgi:hypothetical protein
MASRLKGIRSSSGAGNNQGNVKIVNAWTPPTARERSSGRHLTLACQDEIVKMKRGETWEHDHMTFSVFFLASIKAKFNFLLRTQLQHRSLRDLAVTAQFNLLLMTGRRNSDLKLVSHRVDGDGEVDGVV